MNKIMLEKWAAVPGKPRKMEYVGQPTGKAVFDELRHRLDGMGYLPDEYFDLDENWENGRKIPQGTDIFCTTDYGAEGGIYLDVFLKWTQDRETVTEGFITGMTRGESGNDLDRMFLISSAITKAFIEKAIQFYVSYLTAEDGGSYLPNAFLSTMKSIVAESDNRHNKMMFKQAVELAMLLNVIAASFKIDRDTLGRLRGECVKEVKKTKGAYAGRGGKRQRPRHYWNEGKPFTVNDLVRKKVLHFPALGRLTLRLMESRGQVMLHGKLNGEILYIATTESKAVI